MGWRENARPPTADFYALLLKKYPDVDIRWFLTGDQEMRSLANNEIEELGRDNSMLVRMLRKTEEETGKLNSILADPIARDADFWEAMGRLPEKLRLEIRDEAVALALDHRNRPEKVREESPPYQGGPERAEPKKVKPVIAPKRRRSG